MDNYVELVDVSCDAASEPIVNTCQQAPEDTDESIEFHVGRVLFYRINGSKAIETYLVQGINHNGKSTLINHCSHCKKFGSSHISSFIFLISLPSFVSFEFQLTRLSFSYISFESTETRNCQKMSSRLKK